MSTIRATYVQHGSSTVPNITLNASGQVIVASGIVSSGTFAAPLGSASAPGVYFVGDTNTGLYSPDADQVAISTNGTGRFFINSAGRADVVSTSSVATNITSNQATTYLQLTNSTDAAGILSTGAALGFFAGSAGTERMRIDSSGRLLVGTTSALGPSTTSTGITFFPGDYSVMSSAGNEPLTLNRNNDGAILSCRRSGTNVGSISVTTTATAFNTSSDYRLKENVVDLDGAVDRLKQLPVCRFNFIADPDKTVDGFIAHEVQAVVPEAVTGAKDEVDADGNPIYQGIDQSKLVPLLTAALQEAVAKIESLEARLTAADI